MWFWVNLWTKATGNKHASWRNNSSASVSLVFTWSVAVIFRVLKCSSFPTIDTGFLSPAGPSIYGPMSFTVVLSTTVGTHSRSNLLTYCHCEIPGSPKNMNVAAPHRHSMKSRSDNVAFEFLVSMVWSGSFLKILKIAEIYIAGWLTDIHISDKDLTWKIIVVLWSHCQNAGITVRELV